MKWLGKKILSAVCLALVITLAAALYPYIRELVGEWLPRGKYDRATMVISHEMEKAGELTAVRYTDHELMENTTKVLSSIEVRSVRVPYSYEIGLGIHLSEVRLIPGEEGITVEVPQVSMLYDSFRVTGKPEVNDLLYGLSQRDYQKMLDEQAVDCRAKYMNDEACLENSWHAACEALEKLISQWTGEKIPLKFIHA